MKDFFDAIVSLVSSGSLSGTIVTILLSAVIFVGFLWGLTKVIGALSKVMFVDRVTRGDIQQLKSDLTKLHDNTADLVQKLYDKTEHIYTTTNNISTYSKENLINELTRISEGVEELKVARRDDIYDMMTTVNSLQKDLEQLINNVRDGKSDMDRDISKLQTDLASLHGTIIGLSTNRNRLR